MATTEQWKTLTQNDDYEISNHGHLRHKKTKILRNPHYHKNGYFHVSFLHKNTGKESSEFIHRLVANHFLKKPHSSVSLIVNHKNRIKIDNRSENLEWITNKENTDHFLNNISQGQSNHPIISLKIADNSIKKFISISEAERKLNINKGDIINVLRRKYRTAQGYYFELDNDAETITSDKPNYKAYFKKEKCPECGNDFEKKSNNKKYCSAKCTSLAYKKSLKTNKSNCKCEVCSTPMYKRPYEFKRCKHLFCSPQCHGEFKKGKTFKKKAKNSNYEKTSKMILKLSNKEKLKLIEELKKSI